MWSSSPNLLAQTAAPAPTEILGLLGWIVGLAVVAAVAAFALRVWLRDTGPDDDATAGLGFTLADLRAMRDRGQLDEQEYAAARERLIGTTRGPEGGGAAEAAPPAASVPVEDGGIVWEEGGADPEFGGEKNEAEG